MKLFARRAGNGPPASDEREVIGERGRPVIVRELSLQSRISNLFAMSLMLAVGLGFLIWYYSHAVGGPARAQQRAQETVAGRAAADMALPPLGHIEPPPPRGPAGNSTATPTGQSVPGANGGIPLMALPPPLVSQAPIPPAAAYGATTAPNPRPSAMQRRLSGTTFASTRTAAVAPLPESGAAAASPAMPAAVGWMNALTSLSTTLAPPSVGRSSGGDASNSLSSLLKSDATATVRPRVLPDQRLLLPKGAFIDCTLETAIDSTLPGMATCVTATDTFGADGSVVLLDRGTKLIGETRGQVQQGAARVFVLWTEARTPTGLVVPLDSPGADELGRSGLPGEVERHFWQRFGAAILITSIEGAVQAGVQSASQSGGAVIYDPSATQGVMTEVLKSTLDIAPTVIKRNGDRIQVLVARDVDFSSVYELRRAAAIP